MIIAIIVILLLLLIIGLEVKFPSWTLLIYIVAAGFTETFSERFDQSFYAFLNLYAGIKPIDIVAFPMIIFAFVNLFKDKLVLKGQIRLFSLVFFGFLVISILRNIPVFGFSAIGEFKNFYLWFFSTFYLVYYIKDWNTLKRTLIIITFVSILLIFSGVLYSGLRLGWTMGYKNRFLHSSITLILVNGLMVILLLQKYGLLKKVKGLNSILLLLIMLLFIADGHRSVWMVTMINLFLLILYREIKINLKIVKFLPLLIIIMILITLILNQSGINVSEYINQRLIAFYDYKNDENSNWRIEAWIGASEIIRNNLLIGTGFGGYWDKLFFLTAGKVGIFVHSAYVMNAMKLGVVGMATYFLFVISIFSTFHRELSRGINQYKRPFAMIGMIGIISVHTYGFSYGFEFYSWLLIGVGLLGISSKFSTNLVSQINKI